MDTHGTNGGALGVRRLKVYGWIGQRREARMEGNHHGQTREIIAASSAAEVRRLTGLTRGDWEHSGCETGNEAEIAQAMSSPRTIFWQPLDAIMCNRDSGWTAA